MKGWAKVAVAAMAAAACGAAGFAAAGRLQGHDPEPRLAAQREAMRKLELLDGEWRGTASMLQPDGSKHVVTQTERCGPALDGAIRVVEGRGYEPDGSTSFNAFAVLSYDVDAKGYRMRSWAQGRTGEFVVTPAEHGFSWEIPAGPATIRYTATIEGDTWHEVGERVVSGAEPVRFLEMTLTRIGDSSWPAGGAVPAK